MDGLLLDNFQWLMVILYNYMPTIDVGMKLLEATAHQQTLSLNVGLVSLDISVLLANAVDHPLCIR